MVEFETSYHNPDHGCLETRGCMMQWDGDRLTCWTSYYAADQPRMSLANMLEMPLNKVRVMNPYIGGSFGRGNEADQPFLVFTALLAKRCGGRPVLYRMDRRQDFHDTRSPVLYRMRVGARADGTILALHTKAYSRAGAYADDTMGAADEVPREVAELSLAPIPNLRMEAYCVYTNTIPGGVKRGIGNNELNLAWGRLLDELAERLDLDPVEVALKNMGNPWVSRPDESLAAVLREGAGRIGWDRRRAAPADLAAEPAAAGDRIGQAARPRHVRPQHLARRLAGNPARPSAGPPDAQPGRVCGARRPHRRDGDRLEQLHRVRLCRRARLPGRRRRRHHLPRPHRHRPRPEGHGADRQRRLVPAGRADAEGRRGAQAEAGGAPRRGSSRRRQARSTCAPGGSSGAAARTTAARWPAS